MFWYHDKHDIIDNIRMKLSGKNEGYIQTGDVKHLRLGTKEHH